MSNKRKQENINLLLLLISALLKVLFAKVVIICLYLAVLPLEIP